MRMHIKLVSSANSASCCSFQLFLQMGEHQLARGPAPSHGMIRIQTDSCQLLVSRLFLRTCVGQALWHHEEPQDYQQCVGHVRVPRMLQARGLQPILPNGGPCLDLKGM